MKHYQIIFLIGLFIFIIVGCESTDNIIGGVDGTGISTGSLHGEIQAIDGVVYQVHLLANGNSIAEIETDSLFTFNDVEIGNYTVHISANGYQWKAVTVSVESEITVILDKISLVKLVQVDGLDIGDGLRIGRQAPEFELPDGNGELHSLSAYLESGKNVVIVFYRTGG